MEKNSNLLPEQRIAKLITFFGNWYIVIPTAVIFSFVFSVNTDYFYDFWLNICLLTVFVQILKFYSQSRRPLMPLLIEKTLAFPSGHSATAIFLFGWLASQYYLFSGFNLQTAIIFILTFLIVVLVATSRLMLRVHYLQDIIAGLFIGGVFLVSSLT